MTTKLYNILFEEHSIEDISLSVTEDTSLGQDRKQIWVKATHPKLDLVGAVFAISLNANHPDDIDPKQAMYNPNYFEQKEKQGESLLPEYWQDFDKLRNQISEKDATVWGVQQSWNSRRFRGEGLGKAMYLTLLKYIAKAYNGIVVNNQAWGDQGATSILAQNVWNSLKNDPKIKHVGAAFWGGDISNIELKPKRLHGWERREQYKQPRQTALTQALKNQDY